MKLGEKDKMFVVANILVTAVLGFIYSVSCLS